MDTTYQIHITTQTRPLVAIDRFDIPRGKLTLLFGESGIGKSILSKAMYGLLDPLLLKVTVNGQAYSDYIQTEQVTALKQGGFFVFQEPSSHLNPLLTIETQLREGGLSNVHSEEAILNHLWGGTRDVRMRQLLQVYPKPHRPSGGEKQRFLLAMAFKKIQQYTDASTPSPYVTFVFDEPTGSLDNQARNLFLSLLLDRFRRRPFTTVLITHDYSMISEVYDKHADLIPHFAFKELVQTEKQLVLDDFSPRFYLDWLKANRRPQTRPEPESAGSGDVLLHLASGLRVFGRNLTLHSPDGKPAELALRRGQIVYLKAASGVGKTTLAKVLMGLISAESLNLRIGERQFSERTQSKVWRQHLWGKRVGMVFQHADEALNLNAKVKDVFAGLPYPKKITPEYIRKTLAAYFPFEIDAPFLNKRIRYLSGGQKQRLNLLRTLSLNTDIILLDEPLNGLDFLSMKKVIDLLRQKQVEGKGILLISHNEEIFDSIEGVDQMYLKAEE